MIPEAIDLEMRGGNHPDPVMNNVETQIAETAYRLISNDPVWSELHPRTAYNFLHLNTFYGTRNPELVNLLYRLQPYPSYLEAEVTGRCPFRCIMCEHTYWDEPNYPDWSMDQFKYVIDQFPDLKWAALAPIADPFVNKDFFEMLKYLDDRHVAQEIYMTSGTLQEVDMQKLVNLKGMIMIKFSHDAATPETYEKIRVGVNWDKVVRNIRALAKYKRQAGKFFPRVEFHYIIMKQNIHEAEMFLDWVDSLGFPVTEVMYSRLLHYFPEVKDVYTDIPEGLIEKLKNKGKQLGINVIANSDAQLKAEKLPANMCTQWLMPFIFVSGEVNTCCAQNEANQRKLQKECTMGNIFQQSMRDIWNGKKFRELRTNLYNKRFPSPICQMCVTHNTEGFV